MITPLSTPVIFQGPYGPITLTHEATGVVAGWTSGPDICIRKIKGLIVNDKFVGVEGTEEREDIEDGTEFFASKPNPSFADFSATHTELKASRAAAKIAKEAEEAAFLAKQIADDKKAKEDAAALLAQNPT